MARDFAKWVTCVDMSSAADLRRIYRRKKDVAVASFSPPGVHAPARGRPELQQRSGSDAPDGLELLEPLPLQRQRGCHQGHSRRIRRQQPRGVRLQVRERGRLLGWL